MSNSAKTDNTLTVQVHQGNLNPRTFRIPTRWIQWATGMAWGLLGLTAVSTIYAVREYFAEKAARPELVAELENEVQSLKIALERKTIPVPGMTPAPAAGKESADPLASDQKPPEAAGVPLAGKEGVWSGLADRITLPDPTAVATLRLEDARLDWQGKYAIFTVNVLYHEPGRGSQQGHLVALGRSHDRILAHPEGVLNTASGSALVDPERGEYFSVTRFRVLKARLGPYDTQDQLKEIQVFGFDLNSKLILLQTFKYGK